MKAKIKTIFQTLMFVFVIGFISAVWYAYNTSIAEEQEAITNEVVETLEEIFKAIPEYTVKQDSMVRTFGEFLQGYRNMPIEFKPSI